jgi:hypothetical protein
MIGPFLTKTHPHPPPTPQTKHPQEEEKKKEHPHIAHGPLFYVLKTNNKHFFNLFFLSIPFFPLFTLSFVLLDLSKSVLFQFYDIEFFPPQEISIIS